MRASEAALYNEIEPYACDWLGNLIEKGHIANGRVERRSIADLQPDDVRSATQAHFFAGIGVWSYALRLAGVPDELPVWTGSCPCQPFSAAGRKRGGEDARHLWPEWFRLIRECRPAIIFGEQVASADGLAWLDAVSTDLEGAGYAVGASDLCAAGIGAPHIRQRLYFVAYAQESGRRSRRAGEAGGWPIEPGGSREAGDMGNPNGQREGSVGEVSERPRTNADGGARVPVGHSGDEGPQRHRRSVGLDGPERRQAEERHRAEAGIRSIVADTDIVVSADAAVQRSGLLGRAAQDGCLDFWRDAGWIRCADGFFRPVEPGTFPLAHGAPARVGRLRAYGNAIVAPLAAEFIRAALEAIP